MQFNVVARDSVMDACVRQTLERSASLISALGGEVKGRTALTIFASVSHPDGCTVSFEIVGCALAGGGLQWRRVTGDEILFEKLQRLHDAFVRHGVPPVFVRGEIMPQLGRSTPIAEPCALDAWCLDSMKRCLQEIQVDGQRRKNGEEEEEYVDAEEALQQKKQKTKKKLISPRYDERMSSGRNRYGPRLAIQSSLTECCSIP